MLTVVPTGTANLASVLAGFRRLGTEPVLSRSPDDVEKADGVVLPGVGAFGAAIGEVERSGYREVLIERIEEGRPTLAVCVGMQLLCASSEESPGISGLGVANREVGRFQGSVLVPQLGWNQVRAGEGSRLVTDGWAYFANSFRIDSLPRGWAGATADHGGRFVASMERGDVLACQFHPELSGAWGSEVLERWIGRMS
jgi:imidazole glycerol phosphate synthase glutamine amidotransferase subunit